MTDSLEITMAHCLQRAGECGREEFLREFPNPVVVLVGPEEDEVERFGTLEHGDFSEIPKISRNQLLRDSSLVFPLAKRGSVNNFASMVVIGRADNCDIIIANNRVSKCHAIVRMQRSLRFVSPGTEDPTDMEPAKSTMTDGGSTNGTIVNGKKLKAGEFHELTNGDQISLGPTVNMVFFNANDFYTLLSPNSDEAGS